MTSAPNTASFKIDEWTNKRRFAESQSDPEHCEDLLSDFLRDNGIPYVPAAPAAK